MTFGRPNTRVVFGTTGKPGNHTKKITRDETGELQLSVGITNDGMTRIDFGKPVTHIALPADKAYDFAHLILEHVKDKQGGEPVNVTEEKILAALEFAIEHNAVSLLANMNTHQQAIAMLPYFMGCIAGADLHQPPDCASLDAHNKD